MKYKLVADDPLKERGVQATARQNLRLLTILKKGENDQIRVLSPEHLNTFQRLDPAERAMLHEAFPKASLEQQNQEHQDRVQARAPATFTRQLY